jgi:hypothetical protein
LLRLAKQAPIWGRPALLTHLSQLCDNVKPVNGEFTVDYVILPNGRMPAREFVDSLDDKAAARIDAFIERLSLYGNRMQGKFVKSSPMTYSN